MKEKQFCLCQVLFADAMTCMKTLMENICKVLRAYIQYIVIRTVKKIVNMCALGTHIWCISWYDVYKHLFHILIELFQKLLKHHFVKSFQLLLDVPCYKVPLKIPLFFHYWVHFSISNLNSKLFWINSKVTTNSYRCILIYFWADFMAKWDWCFSFKKKNDFR